MNRKYSACVVTFYKHNYGAFLQAYALQQFLICNGMDATVLNYDYAKDNTILGVPFSKVKKPVSFVKSIGHKIINYKVGNRKNRLFHDCAEKYIRQTRYYKHYKDVLSDPPQADIYITGSDQVWNPYMSPQGLDSRFLTFADKKESVICSYAASLGFLYLNGELKELFKSRLSLFDLISVREERSCITLEEVTDKEINVNKDPAILLDRTQWDIFARSYDTDNPFIFLYLAQKDEALLQFAKELSKKTGWGILDCHASVNYTIDCINGERIISPMEFVGAIRDAKYVVTNSFHCLVFSIHYKKCAYIKMPQKRSERLSELMESMELQRLTNSELITEEECESIYKKSDDYLMTQRNQAVQYFKEVEAIYEDKRNHDI